MSIDLHSFTVKSEDPADRFTAPEIVYDEHRSVTFPDSAGEYDARVGIEINVDGMFDIVVPETNGFDKIQVLNRAIEALSIARDHLADFANITGDLAGKCLDVNETGHRCTVRGQHDQHDFVKDGAP